MLFTVTITGHHRNRFAAENPGAFGDAADGGQVALGLGDEGGGEAPLHLPRSARQVLQAALQLRVRAQRDRAVHEDAQRRAPAVRRDVRQLPAAPPPQLRQREARPDICRTSGWSRTSGSSERVVRDGPPRHAGGPGAAAGGCEHGEQGGGREEARRAAAAAAAAAAGRSHSCRRPRPISWCDLRW